MRELHVYDPNIENIYNVLKFFSFKRYTIIAFITSFLNNPEIRSKSISIRGSREKFSHIPKKIIL